MRREREEERGGSEQKSARWCDVNQGYGAKQECDVLNLEQETELFKRQ